MFLKRESARFFAGLLLVCCSLLQSAPGLAEDYSFDLDEFEKKSFTWGGYAELKGEHNGLNRHGAFGLLGLYDTPRSDLDRLTSTIQLNGNLNKAMVDFNWQLQAFTQQDQLESDKELNVFSAYASIKPSPSVTIEVGKKTFKWGKGYAWSPVGFIDRPKDPNNPEEALEGYIGAGVDLIKSYPGTLQTLAFTGVLLPVWEDVNDDFGEKNNINFAAKLYLLYRDTDIDFIFFTGDSRSTRFGVDISKNLATNFEIHAELAHIPGQKIKRLNNLGSLSTYEESVTSYLLGLRYLTENDITTILEYYHNDAGYSENQMDQFYQLVSDAHSSFSGTGDDSLLRQAARVSKSGYARPQAGRNYLYLRVTQKEPFDLLYFTPGVTAILNLDDSSYSLSPEAVYTGFTNWEMRLRYSRLDGGRFTEYGEKVNEDKLELRIRYYF
ncbi:hypothetical protein SAMN02745165_02870 [Malonomonas rubra DSM 5091]|uniref:Porin n=1 Tax=Malonomonas rubra DSM 5091 TaxID=1122189 RepID=A0A1M6L560_MALRU|nr:hypothetical protein [Malonomonas rubra]SHJ66264.1 hypothetical protein SAMN02745165_02870 [Malonomonas rubra DSM 5091]